MVWTKKVLWTSSLMEIALDFSMMPWGRRQEVYREKSQPARMVPHLGTWWGRYLVTFVNFHIPSGFEESIHNASYRANCRFSDLEGTEIWPTLWSYRGAISFHLEHIEISPGQTLVQWWWVEVLPWELDSVSSHQLTRVLDLRQVVYPFLASVPMSVWIIMVTLEITHGYFS